MQEQIKKKLLAYFQSEKRLQTRRAVLQDFSGNEMSDSQTQANLVSYVFALSYRSDDGAEPPPLSRHAGQINPIFISHNVIESALAS